MIEDVIAEIVTSDLKPSTKTNALALLNVVNRENGHAMLTWQELMDLFSITSVGRARKHLGVLQGANLIHYSTNGDDMVYVNFKAWTRAHARKTSTERTENVQKVDEKRAPTRASDGDEADGARAHARKTSTERTKNDQKSDATYTHASAPELVGWLDLPSDPDRDNQPTSGKPGTDEIDLSLRLLTAIRMIPDNANHIAKTYRFERIREVVGHWWMNRASVGGTLKNDCGFVVRALLNPKQFGIQPLSEEFRRTDLYRMFRTPAEIAEDEERERQAISPPLPAAVVLPSADPSPYLTSDPGWLGLQGNPLMEHLAGVVSVEDQGDVLAYVIGMKDVDKLEWARMQRLDVKLRKALSAILGRPAVVCLEEPTRKEAK